MFQENVQKALKTDNTEFLFLASPNKLVKIWKNTNFRVGHQSFLYFFVEVFSIVTPGESKNALHLIATPP